MKTRGFPRGTPRNRLSAYQKQVILEMLAMIPNGAEVARRYNATGGRVTLATVCTIKRQAIACGYIARVPLKKERA